MAARDDVGEGERGRLDQRSRQIPWPCPLVDDEIDGVDGEVVRSEWTCTSPVFEAPIRGVDVCTVRDGRITRLEVSFA